MTQTAVEYIIDKMQNAQWEYTSWTERKEIIDQAKEMEKQQIIDAHISGYDSSGGSAKDYYDFYYGSNKKIKFTEDEWADLNNGSKGSDETKTK